MDSLSPKYTNEIKFSTDLKGKLGKLGYNATTFEDLIIEIISKGGAELLSKVNTLQETVANLSTANLPSGSRTFGLKSGGVDAVQLTSRSVDYSTSEDTFTYSIDNIKKNLPAGFNLISGRASVIDNQGKKSSVTGTGSTIKIPSLPATAQITAVIQTANGTLELEKEILLTKGAQGTAVLDVRDLTTAPSTLYQKEFNEVMAAEIALLKQKL